MSNLIDGSIRVRRRDIGRWNADVVLSIQGRSPRAPVRVLRSRVNRGIRMKIVRRDETSRTVLELKGSLTGQACDELAAAVSEARQSKQASIAIDLGAVAMVDSAGLEQLLRCRERCADAGGICELINLSPNVSKILRFTRLDREFNAA